jgi:hypothetical protein
MCSSTHSSTSALDGGEWSASRPAALPPGKEPLVPIGYENTRVLYRIKYRDMGKWME